MAEFTNIDDLGSWLRKQLPAVNVVIATRASLRVLPLMALEFNESAYKPDAVAGTVVLPVFRATAASWVAGTFPARERGLAGLLVPAVANASLISVGAAIGAAVASPAVFVAVAAEAAAAAVVPDLRAAADAAADAADAAADAAEAALKIAFSAKAATGGVLAFWKSVSSDATQIENDMAPEKLACAPLWHNETPGWVINYQDELEQRLLGMDSRWRVWTHWYEARLRGEQTFSEATAEQNEKLEIARAAIADEIWDKGRRR